MYPEIIEATVCMSDDRDEQANKVAAALSRLTQWKTTIIKGPVVTCVYIERPDNADATYYPADEIRMWAYGVKAGYYIGHRQDLESHDTATAGSFTLAEYTLPQAAYLPLYVALYRFRGLVYHGLPVTEAWKAASWSFWPLDNPALDNVLWALYRDEGGTVADYVIATDNPSYCCAILDLAIGTLVKAGGNPEL